MISGDKLEGEGLMSRQARLDAPGTLYHIVGWGIERKKIVVDENDRQDFVSRMGGLSSETDTAIYAWYLLSNHAHILLYSGAVGLTADM